MDDNTVNTGIVIFVDDRGVTRQIDFIQEPAGVDHDETLETSIRADILDVDGKAVVATFRVMHPMLSLESRAYNVARLPGYQSPHAQNQLRAAIECVREFSRDRLDEDPLETLKLNEDVFCLARWGAGPLVFARFGIDVLGAVVDAPGIRKNSTRSACLVSVTRSRPREQSHRYPATRRAAGIALLGPPL